MQASTANPLPSTRRVQPIRTRRPSCHPRASASPDFAATGEVPHTSCIPGCELFRLCETLGMFARVSGLGGHTMSDPEDPAENEAACPNCGAAVVYGGVGRRPVWCSTRCRNDAALRRLGARKGAIEVRVVEVSRPTAAGAQRRVSGDTAASNPAPEPATEGSNYGAAKPSPEQALRVIRNDPEAVGKLLVHLERRRLDGTLSAPEWLPVRNGLRLIAGALPAGIERPSPPR